MKKEVTLSILLVVLFSIAIQQAFAANISGTIRSNGSGLSDAKVTAEAVGEYQWTRTATTGSIGTYSLSTSSTNSYTVQSSKTGYTQASSTANGGSGGVDLNLSTRPLTNIVFKIAFDTSQYSRLTIDQARFYLYSAKPWFREEHSIDFTETGPGTAWVSSNNPTDTCEAIRDSLPNGANWNSNGYGIAEVLIGFTGKNMTDGGGCINTIPNGSHQHPYIAITNFDPDMARVVMHEVSHAFGLQHNLNPCSTQIPGIMANICPSIYIKNWVPSDDAIMETNRDWYAGPQASVAITYPANNAIVSPGGVLFSGIATSAYPITSVDFSFEGGPYTQATPNNPGDWSGWSYAYSNYPAGSHWVLARVTDSAGRQAWNSITVIADIAPSISITSPANNAFVNPGSTVTFTGTSAAGTSASHITAVDFSYEGGPYSPAQTSDGYAHWSYTFNNYPTGPGWVLARATDNFGMQQWVSISVNGATPLGLTITYPANNGHVPTGSTVTFTGTTSLTGGTVTAVDFSFEGGTYTSTQTSDGFAHWSYSYNNYPAGSSWVLLRATDSYGRQVWQSITVNSP